MARHTIDFGIDLGTTNSSIAILERTGPTVIRNREGTSEVTPSAVHIDKNGVVNVGRAAKSKLEVDEANAACEFKRSMGTVQSKVFKRSGITMSPEELSAEVLKSLKQDVESLRGETVEAAVITVPADFDQPQCASTRKAAELAGIRQSPLLTEPVAAALAYSFQREIPKSFWLMYDFGGGTFDAALVRFNDSIGQVVNHGGDNLLGGGDIDRSIVDHLLVPELQRHYNLIDFNRGNPKWSGAFGKLKLAAEEAKIRVSTAESAEIQFDYLCQDDNGESVELEFTLTRHHVERFIEPLTRRAIAVCKKVLSEKRIGPSDVEKLVLVGGPTLTPYMRQMLSDSSIGLGIPLEFSIDPLTVVARGAAVFAGGLKIDFSKPAAPEAGTFQIELEYQPMGTDTEPTIGGKVLPPPGQRVEGGTVELVNANSQPPWRSGKIKLNSNGAFMTQLFAEANNQNIFAIELCDVTGKKLRCSPSELTYTVTTVVFERPPLEHNIGVETLGNKISLFFKKGTSLPARKMRVHTTAEVLRPGKDAHGIHIPVVEGPYPKADLNRAIGFLSIFDHQIRREIPPNSEVEITLEIDESRILKGEAYIPVIDQSFELPMIDMKKPTPKPEELKTDITRQSRRIEELKRKLKDIEDQAAREELKNIDQQNLIGDIKTLLVSARNPDDARVCENRIKELKAKLDRVEDDIEIPALKLEARHEIEWTRQALASAEPDDRHRGELLISELDGAIDGDPEELRRKIDELNSFRMSVAMGQMEWWLGMHSYLLARRAELNDQDAANKWLVQAERSVAGGDFEALKAACRQLWALLPADEQQRGYGGNTFISKDASMGTSA